MVTIETSPSIYTPSGNPVDWTFSSDQTAQANFSYLVEVYVNSVLQGNHQIFPSNGIYARFDASSYAETFCNVPTLSNSLVVDAGNIASISITVIERFGDPIADGASGSSSDIYAFKGKLREKPFTLFDTNDYEIVGKGRKYLTLFPSATDNMKCGDNEQQRLLALSNLIGDGLVVTLYDALDVVVSTDTVVPPVARTLIINASQAAIIAGTTITQADFDASSYYTIVLAASSTGWSLLQRIDIDRECHRATHKRLTFLSTIGSIESFTYGLYSNETGKVKSHTMEQEFGNWNGNEFNYSFQAGTKRDFQKTGSMELILRSNWLSEGEQNWLAVELTFSPVVYIEDSEEVGLGLSRVANSKNNFTIKTTRQNKLFKQTFNLGIESFTSTSV